jgi:selenocysteine-specific elongation factor
LETLARGTPEDRLLHILAGPGPTALKAAVGTTGMDAATADRALTAMIEKGHVILFGVVVPPLTASNTPALSLGGWRDLAGRMELALNDYHVQYPLRGGMAREELKSRVQGRERWPAKLFNEMLARAAAERVLVETAGELVARPGFRPTFSPAQQARVDALLAAFRRQPYSPPSMAESMAQTDAEIISALVYQEALVRLSDDVLLLRETYDEMLARIVDHIKQSGSITVAQVRDMFNTSRKYALALMEYLDDHKVTRRVGDERVLR